MIYVSGPGHGGPVVVANTYLEGAYSEIYPDISQNEDAEQVLLYKAAAGLAISGPQATTSTPCRKWSRQEREQK